MPRTPTTMCPSRQAIVVTGGGSGSGMAKSMVNSPAPAATALAQLDAAYAGWIGGVRGLAPGEMARAIGPAEGPWADRPMAELVLHINREMLHHGAEIALLRDLYRWHLDGRGA